MFSFRRALVGLLTPLLMMAQSHEATVSGFVRDAQGAAVAGAKITAKNISNSGASTAESNESGFYSIQRLPIGAYEVQVERAGFNTYVRKGLQLTTGQVLGLDVELTVGAINQSVTVDSAAPLVETRNSDVNQLIEAKTMEDIPLGDRRTLNVVNLTGAAVFVNYDSGSKPNFSLAGGRSQSQNFFLDGGTIQNMRLGVGQVDTDPPVETVAEVKVLSNSYSAEYGGSAGGVIVATTKSGTNSIRGSAYEYLRNDKLDASNFFAPIRNGEKVKAPLRYNVFGITVGGPVVIPKLYDGRNKTFFFGAYEGSRRREGATDVFTVPTLEQRSGDFSRTTTAAGAVIPVFDPATTRQSNGTNVRDQFPGNIIPANRIDPVAQALVNLYPLPNRPADNLTGANNYSTNYTQGLTRDAVLAKVDHTLTSKDSFSVRYLYNSDNLDFTSVMPIAASDMRTPALRHQHFFYGQYTRVISPTVVNEFRFTYGNRVNHQQSLGLGQNWPDQLGLRGVANDAFPTINVAGYRQLGATAQERRQFPIQQFQYLDNLSVIRGKHSWKLGAEARPSYNYEVNLPSVSGNFTFNPLATGQPGAANSGTGLASLLVGFPNAFTARSTQVLDRRSWYLAAFVQDDWSVHRDLTLNLGVRWETDTAMVDVNNRMNSFDVNEINPVSGTPGVVKFMGVDGFRTSPYNTDWNNFGPRIGLAWKPFGSAGTVVRTGYGVFFAHPFDGGVPAAASLGYEVSANIASTDNGITAPFYLRDGVPVTPVAPTLSPGFGAVLPGRNPNTSVSFFEGDRRTGYSQQFHFSIQRALTQSALVEVSYLGNLSRKLSSSNLSLNQVPPSLLTATSSQINRPFPQFTDVILQSPTLGVTNYHAFVVRGEKRFSHGFNILTTYTFSKFLSNTNDSGSVFGANGGPYSNFYNRAADYGPAENDIRHRFTYMSVYELPVGKGKRYLANNFAGTILGNWTLSGVVTMQSGAPFTVTTQTNTVYSAAGALRADVVRNPNLDSGERSIYRWFDTAAFAQPAPGRFGNQGVGLIRGPGIFNADLSILRNFPLPGEGRKVQIRGEFLNATNHTNFGGPGRVFGAPGFGVISSAAPARRIQLGARFIF
jgi:hypothetical protein